MIISSLMILKRLSTGQCNSEKRASRKFFGGLKKKRSERGDVIFLTEADFKD